MDVARPPRSAKSTFAKRVESFANRARGSIAFPLIEVVCLMVAFVAAISGPFQTGAMPLPQRSMFWTALMSWSAIKWRLWFIFAVRDRAHAMRVSAIGAVLLNLVLPLEIQLLLGLVKIEAQVVPVQVIFQAFAISAAAFAVTYAVRSRRRASTLATVALPGPLARLGIDPTNVAAVRAEDHYCRVWLDGCRNRLILARFRDVLGELRGTGGLQVHRGAWLADGAVRRVRRVGRAWKIEFEGEAFPISSRHVGAARDRGWLSRRER